MKILAGPGDLFANIPNTRNIRIPKRSTSSDLIVSEQRYSEGGLYTAVCEEELMITRI